MKTEFTSDVTNSYKLAHSSKIVVARLTSLPYRIFVFYQTINVAQTLWAQTEIKLGLLSRTKYHTEILFAFWSKNFRNRCSLFLRMQEFSLFVEFFPQITFFPVVGI